MVPVATGRLPRGRTAEGEALDRLLDGARAAVRCSCCAATRASARLRSGGILWDSALANFEPGPQGTWVDYRNATRPPPLLVSGGEDHLMPPVVQHANANHYTLETLADVKVFEGRSHLLPAQRGREESADYALSWAERHAVAATGAPNYAPTPSGRR